MPKSSLNTFAATSLYEVWTAPLYTPLPTTILAASALVTAGWSEVGYISDDGITETHDVNDNIVYDLLGQQLRNLRNQEQRSFGFTADEDNRVVRELKYVGSSLTTAGGTAEVQTVTLSNTPTGGTFPLTLPGYGTTYTAAYNATAATVQSGVQSAWGLTVTVSLTGSTYTFTFPASAGNVPQIQTNGSSLTPASATANSATTTPGVNPTNTRAIGSGTGSNNRCWFIKAQDGAKQQAFAVGNGEASATGDSTFNSGALKTTQFTVRTYPDLSGNFFYLLDNDPSQNVAYA